MEKSQKTNIEFILFAILVTRRRTLLLRFSLSQIKIHAGIFGFFSFATMLFGSSSNNGRICIEFKGMNGRNYIFFSKNTN
jgi:hypothetical protein